MMGPVAMAEPAWRNRIVAHGEADPAALLDNPRNWRTHPRPQLDALEGVLREVGFVQDVIVNRTTGHVVDGHARIALARKRKEAAVPVVYVELSPAEEATVLATLDPLGAMAGADRGALEALLREVGGGAGPLAALIGELAVRQGVDPANRQTPWDLAVDWSDPDGDGVEVAAGYRLCSMWYGISRDNAVRRYMLPLPPRPDRLKGGTIGYTYSRTNAEETERIVTTYLRPGDRFYELCCGWMTFSSTAKYYGYSGRGSDIWDTALAFCARQLAAMPGAGVVDVVRADCRATGEPAGAYDFVHSNPPFFDLEPYSGEDGDLAALGTYDRWLEAMAQLGAEAARLLRPGGLANFVINDYRAEGALVPMHADFIGAVGRTSGLVLHDLVVAEVLSQALRFRQRDYARRRTVKCHEYVVTFRKPGDGARAS